MDVAAEIARLRELAANQKSEYLELKTSTIISLLDALEQAQKERDETVLLKNGLSNALQLSTADRRLGHERIRVLTVERYAARVLLRETQRQYVYRDSCLYDRIEAELRK